METGSPWFASSGGPSPADHRAVGPGQEGDKVTALDAGADDYLTKPSEPARLSRIRVALRRVGGSAAGPDPGRPIKIDQPRHLVTVDGREIHLTPIEFRLLLELAVNRARAHHRKLLTEIWGRMRSTSCTYVRVHMAG